MPSAVPYGSRRPLVGYSDRVNDPEILASVKKNRKAAGIFGLIIVPIPFIGFLIYSMVTDKMELPQAMMIGGIVSGVFLIFALFGLLRSRSSNSYEGVVTDKKTSWEHRGNSRDDRRMIRVYTTVVRTEDGGTKKITEREGSMIWAWDYLDIGDHFKYHPQFNFPYELYDKSKAPYIACVGCTTKNPVGRDRCKKCGLPLLI